jgi:hypothetical protein
LKLGKKVESFWEGLVLVMSKLTKKLNDNNFGKRQGYLSQSDKNFKKALAGVKLGMQLPSKDKRVLCEYPTGIILFVKWIFAYGKMGPDFPTWIFTLMTW